MHIGRNQFVLIILNFRSLFDAKNANYDLSLPLSAVIEISKFVSKSFIIVEDIFKVVFHAIKEDPSVSDELIAMFGG
jgi:hypothetical protein